MPLLSLGLAFTGTFLYAFRSSSNYPGEGNDTGQVTVVNGPLPSTVTFTKNGAQVRDQAPRNLEPFELTQFYTDENGEYFLSGTSAIMACIQAYMGSTPGGTPTLILRCASGHATDKRWYYVAPFWICERPLR